MHALVRRMLVLSFPSRCTILMRYAVQTTVTNESGPRSVYSFRAKTITDDCAPVHAVFSQYRSQKHACSFQQSYMSGLTISWSKQPTSPKRIPKKRKRFSSKANESFELRSVVTLPYAVTELDVDTTIG